MTQGEYERETEFVDNFIKEHHRLPTISDAIELTREQMMKEAVEVAVEGYIGGDGVYVFVDLPTRKRWTKATW